ncbi:uncharacterized protein [Panulirus ornatus]|uniref:uncharacterized protein n=1 Tax=Panulirus ornatus TaxID=150431 RepID=UPI003A857201
MFVVGCVAAPTASTVAFLAIPLPLAAPLAVQHEVTVPMPADVKLLMMGEALAVAHPVASTVPGYTAQSELRQVEHTISKPEPVEVDLKSPPVLTTYTAHAGNEPALPVAEVKALEVPALALISSNLDHPRRGGRPTMKSSLSRFLSRPRLLFLLLHFRHHCGPP